MSQHTSRDLVWNKALELAISEDPFELEELRDSIGNQPGEWTVRDTLDAMVDHGWLSTTDSQRWKPGPQFKNSQFHEESEGSDDSEKVVPLSECDESHLRNLSTDKVYEAAVDRISGSGNAIVDFPKINSHLNLGPIDESAVGEEVTFQPIDGIYAKCLTKEYVPDTYHPKSSRTGAPSGTQDRTLDSANHSYNRSTSSNTSPDDPNNLNKLLSGHK